MENNENKTTPSYIYDVFENTPMLIEKWSKYGEILSSNTYAYKFMGFFTKEEYIKNINIIFPRLQPNGTVTKEIFKDAIKEIFEKGIVTPFELMFLKKNGDKVWLKTIGGLVTHNNAKIAITYSHDVTAMHILKEELTNYKDKIKISEENNQLKSKFFANISSGMRMPLTSIIGISEINLRNKSLSPTIREAFNKIYSSGNILLQVINDTIDINKIETGKIEIINEEYALKNATIEIINICSVYSEEKNIKFILDLDKTVYSHLIGDVARIRQVLTTLLLDVFKYKEEGTVTLKIRHEFLDKNEDGMSINLVITITDTELNVKEEQLQNINNKPYTYELPNKSTYSTGMGVSIASTIISLMKGYINIANANGIGREITVTIPQQLVKNKLLEEETIQELSNPIPQSLPNIMYSPMPWGKILVVDDTEINLYVTRGLLSPYELQVETVDSGFKAIDKIINGNTYDIIFMDHIMPDLDGIETVKILRSTGYKNPIVALSANSVIGYAKEFIKNDFNDFLPKPIDTKRLNTLIEKYVKDNQPQKHKNNKSIKSKSNNTLNKNGVAIQVRTDFLKTQKNAVTNIRKAISEKNFKEARLIAHTLKNYALLLEDEELIIKSSHIEKTLSKEKEPKEADIILLNISLLGKIKDIKKDLNDYVSNLKI